MQTMCTRSTVAGGPTLPRSVPLRLGSSARRPHLFGACAGPQRSQRSTRTFQVAAQRTEPAKSMSRALSGDLVSLVGGLG